MHTNFMITSYSILDLSPRVDLSNLDPKASQLKPIASHSQLQRILNIGSVALLGFRPVDNLPNALDIPSLIVEVLDQKG
jgi:hypothetical protein